MHTLFPVSQGKCLNPSFSFLRGKTYRNWGEHKMRRVVIKPSLCEYVFCRDWSNRPILLGRKTSQKWKKKLSAHKTIFHLFNLDKNVSALILCVSMDLARHRLVCWQWVWWCCVRHGGSTTLFWLCPTQSVTCLRGLALVQSMWHMDYYYFKKDRDRQAQPRPETAHCA